MFFSSKSQNISPIDLIEEDGDLFQAVPFFNRPKFYGRHYEILQCMNEWEWFYVDALPQGYVLSNPPFYRGRVKA